ncbi:TraR/DksA family transcriptional regulator [Panacibacter ginsenosidivorans]|uniref:TraR/DksA family transcriptional regulator n=1 Tax=Panacibacter ginsenosidivorans TaxID=1813871 RepID=A0A5B8V9D6_9BACT|nr:TraR/DksA C4-type zinc finger protein [Panacibacter ginsenosidivorans]QEC67755.1 TraR/DksA family transcriptional regulator [Panacibacter ginsenosidivorans]
MATKKPAAKKAAPAKKIAKPVAKAAPKKAAPKKAAAKPVAKPAHKPVAKAATPKKAVKAAPKPAAKPAHKPVSKPAPKPAAKTAPVKQTAVVKKEAEKKHVVEAKPLVAEVKRAPVVKVTPAPTRPAKIEPPKEVKVPKTTVKTSVPYQPGYTPLEKRTDSPKTNEPLVRYSDSDLGEFRDLINKKLEAAKKELAYLQGLITRKDDMGGDETDNRYMTMEDGSMSMEREQLSQMASRQITYIDHLEKALIRIENKTYGICRVTGKLIDKARLRAVPHATLSLEAKLGLVKPGTE